MGRISEVIWNDNVDKLFKQKYPPGSAGHNLKILYNSKTITWIKCNRIRRYYFWKRFRNKRDSNISGCSRRGRISSVSSSKVGLLELIWNRNLIFFADFYLYVLLWLFSILCLKYKQSKEYLENLFIGDLRQEILLKSWKLIKETIFHS